MTSDDLLQPGTFVAGYEVDSLLGRGGMAVVYRATQQSLKRTVALKVLAKELSTDSSFRERFEREGQLQAAIDHLHIVPVYEAGSSEHGLFLAMRLIAGPTLKELIAGGELDPRRALRLLAQVAQALDAAHRAGLIHRDVKPQNILVGEGDHAYLADFGLIKAPDEAGLTGTGQFMGTIDYIAPEQIRGESSGPPSDCYALAAVMFECLTGKVPFARGNEMATMQAQLTEPPPRCSELRPGLPAALDDVIASGMAKDPAQRPRPTSELVRAAVRALATGETARRGTSPQAAAATETPAGQQTVAARIPDQAVASAGLGAPTVAAATATPAAPAAGRQRAGGIAFAIVAALAAAAIAAGFFVGRSGRAPEATQLSSATAGPLQLRYPGEWRLAASPATVPGLTFASPVTLVTAGGRLTAGIVPGAGGPTLLSRDFAERLSGSAPRPDRVLLGSIEAYRYSDLAVKGAGGPVTLYAAPTAAGVATIACAPTNPATAPFQRRCGALAATLRLVGSRALGFAPSRQYAQLLSRTFGKLSGAVAVAAPRLRAAKTPRGQAAAAGELAQAYATAATELRSATVSPLLRDAQQDAVAALNRLAGGYRQAGRAARDQQKGAYNRAGREIRQAEAALDAAVRGLSKLGFRVAA